MAMIRHLNTFRRSSEQRRVFSRVEPKQHRWVTVVNPTNHQLLLQACDDCGVVKSENSVIRNCKGAINQCLITQAQADAIGQIA